MNRSRRDFLKLGAAGLAGLAVPRGILAQEPDAPRPNMLLFVSDDMGWRDAGCYGSPNAKTPNLDRLASQGMRFTNAYTASPVCGPTRAQLYCGMYPVNSRAYFNHPSHYVKEGVRTLPACLKELGYRVGIVGKVDAGPVEAYPFELLKYGWGDGGRELVGPAVREFVTRDPEQPFCLVVGCHYPHTPWPKEAPHFDPAELTVPGHLVDTPETRAALALYYEDVMLGDAQVGACMALLDDTGRTDDTLFLWTSEQGAEMPFGKGTLFDNGMKLGVITRWPGHVEPGAVCDEIIQHVDFLPTMVDAAGGARREEWDGKSFLPMLEGEAVPNHEFAYGCYGSERAVRTKEFKYIRDLSPGGLLKHGVSPFNEGAMASDPKSQFYRCWSHPKSWLPLAETDPAVARKVEWFRQRPAEGLYDIAKDSFETDNLADDPAYAKVLAGLRARCDAIMAVQGDRGMATVNELKRYQQGRHRAGEGYYGDSVEQIRYPGGGKRE